MLGWIEQFEIQEDYQHLAKWKIRITSIAGILNRLQREHGIEPTPFARLRPQVSHGVRGMLGAGFGLTPDASAYAPLAARSPSGQSSPRNTSRSESSSS